MFKQLIPKSYCNFENFRKKFQKFIKNHRKIFRQKPINWENVKKFRIYF